MPPLAANGLSLGSHMPRRRRLQWIIVGLIATVVGLCTAALTWYNLSLSPLKANESARIFRVETGDSADIIGQKLVTQKFIKSELAFKIALRLSGRASAIQAGVYQLSAAESTTQIINKLAAGQQHSMQLQISPGITLKTVRQQLINGGFTATEVDAAFAQNYNHPLLAGKPPDASLEGYIFPDTYFIDPVQSPSVVIAKAFDTLYQKIKTENLEAAFADNGLTIRQAIILASIIEKEVAPADRPHVAQVFLKRLSIGMPLGSDVTFLYAAEQMGVAPRVDLASPYNTRIVTGLPPGPIANVSLSSLQAIASPTATDDLYFVAGDDNVTYFAKTLPEHEANVARHCIKKCQL